MKYKRIVMFLLIILFLGVLAYYYPILTGKAVNNNIDYETERVFVFKVVDGDTIETDNGTIRFLGINTPEKGKPYYNEAKNYLIQNIENKYVDILRDKEDLDRYDRKLRYVFYNDRLINVEIIEQGFATTFMIEDLKYKDKIVDAEKFAKENGIGLWRKSSDVCSGCIKLVELNAEVDYFIIKNDCDFDCNLGGWLVKDDANHFFKLDNLKNREMQTYNSKQEIWNDEGDRFFMRDAQGNLVFFYEY